MYVVKAGGQQVNFEKGPPCFASFIRRCCALAFVPFDRLQEALGLLTCRAEAMEDSEDDETASLGGFCLEMITYIKNTWFEMFSPKDWNVYEVKYNCIY